MAYYSGTASTLTDLKTALLTHAQADGWVLTGDVLSKAGVYFQIQATVTNLTCLGCESDAVLNPAPNVVSMGRIFERSGYPTREISFPCNYEVFGFSQEIYLVANYDVDSYQWMAFGKSTVPGLPGQGGWCGATIGQFTVATVTTDPVYINQDGGGGGSYPVSSAALFWTTFASVPSAHNSFVNHGLDGYGWKPGATGSEVQVGIRHISTILAIQPSAWNSEATLMPVRAYQERPSFKASLKADLLNARILRIDNLTPGDILTLGSDKWKVFPWYRKDASSRDGTTSPQINHTGTFGWVIRYEGP